MKTKLIILASLVGITLLSAIFASSLFGKSDVTVVAATNLPQSTLTGIPDSTTATPGVSFLAIQKYAHSETLTTSANGIEISAANFRVEKNEFRADLCFQVPNDNDWVIADVGIQVNGTEIPPYGGTTFERTETRTDGQRQIMTFLGDPPQMKYQPMPPGDLPDYRCDTLYFEINSEFKQNQVTLVIRSIGSTPREGEGCYEYRDLVQSLLDSKLSGIKVDCAKNDIEFGASSRFIVVDKPASMSQKEAEDLVSNVFRDAFMITGPWIFTGKVDERKEPVTLQASSFLITMTLDDLIRESELIVIGEVTTTLPSMWDRQNEKDAQQATLEEIAASNGLFTDSIITIKQVVKGVPEDSTVRVRTFRGETDQVRWENSNEPEYLAGHTYLLFLEKDTGATNMIEPGDYISSGAIQGVYEIVDGKAISIGWTGDWTIIDLVAYIRKTLRANNPFGPHVNEGDSPLLNAEKVSLAEAQARVSSFSIPLPEGFEIEQVWITKDEVPPDEQYVAVQFKTDLLLITYRLDKPPDWDGIIQIAPDFKKITVNGNDGMGSGPGSTTYQGKDYPYPGSIEWWVDGLVIKLYSETRSLDELLKIAETVH